MIADRVIAANLRYAPTLTMNRQHFLRIACCALLFLFGAAGAFAQSKAGAIKAVRVTGAVVKIAANGTESPVGENTLLLETDTVRTGGGASVVLVFANGSSVHLGETSRLAIEEFKMDPLAEDIVVANLTDEPNVSRTRLNLAYGEMVGNVKKLNASSSYDVRTPVGAAGIRGTTYRIKLRFEPNGQVSFTLSTFEGNVSFAGTIQVAGGEVTQAGGTQEVAVVGGTEINAVATVDTTTGSVTSVQVTAPVVISAVAQQAITQAVTQAIQQAQQTTTITTNEQQSTANNTPPPNTTPVTTNTVQEAQQQQQQPSQSQDQQSQRQQTPADSSTNQPGTNPLNPQDRSPGGE